ncbi:MAG TPA: beta-L-arabinofuranosidase domain-containing protein [Candidatus Sulfotelmatobacter sp.]|nr:beta-L-arabinofuranosidase domain-containing protein [Candidatus Sulfotelmatobacter sp.]
MFTRRNFFQSVMWSGATSIVPCRILRWLGTNPTHNSTPVPFSFLPLTSILPKGWLKQQLQSQAQGLSGHLEEVWKDVGSDSGWLGGKGESWERGPYYLDGYVPLAYLLDDASMKRKAQKWIDWTLGHIQENGMFGPPSNDDWWPRMVMLKVLTQYYEATGDARVISAMTRYFDYQLSALPARPLRDWGKFRWHDEAVSVLWLHDRTKNPNLLQLVRLLHQQGYDWRSGFENFEFTQKVDRTSLGLDASDALQKIRPMAAHGVNNAMGLKHSPLWYRMSGDENDRVAFYEQLRKLDQFHGQPNGLFSADEHLAGRNPSQGTETCTVVEMMYSLEHALAVLGDVEIADRLEKIAFNALPAALTDDMWARQYDQQANQIRCDKRERQWSTNGPESNLFSLEGNFGCCTANFHQGWPKFVSSMWMRTPENGLAAVAYGPNLLRTRVANDVGLEIEQKTEYPFRQAIEMEVRPERKCRFPLFLRIPAWAEAPTVRVNGETVEATPGRFAILDRTWTSGDKVRVAFPAKPRVITGSRDSVSVELGPLVFSLEIPQKWSRLVDRGLASDWEVAPTGAWNSALRESSDPKEALRVVETPGSRGAFAQTSASIKIVAKASAVPGWNEEQGSAGEMPKSPVTTNPSVTELTLIPYGAAKLRITAFPKAQQPSVSG